MVDVLSSVSLCLSSTIYIPIEILVLMHPSVYLTINLCIFFIDLYMHSLIMYLLIDASNYLII